MSDLTPEDIDRLAEAIAPKLVDRVRKDHHDFWIDPEKHYKDHMRRDAMSDEEVYEMKNLVKMFRTTKALAFKAFLGFAIVGTIAAIAVGFGVKHG